MTPLVFTAHSLPANLPDVGSYEQQIRVSSALVAEKLAWKNWRVAYQSRSGRPEDPWLEPDIVTALGELAEQGHTAAVVAPIGFVCDHVEVLYDLDIEAAAAADTAGMTFIRAPTVGVHPSFIRTLADVARTAFDEGGEEL
jgi:ferrochelatase